MSEETKPVDPRVLENAKKLFVIAPFIRDMGVELTAIGTGWVESRLTIEQRHHQHNGMLHAGVATAIADHSAGAAAATVAPPGKIVLTVEFKVNLLRPGIGKELRCRAEVLKPGKQFTICESEVFVSNGSDEKLVAKAMVTLANVDLSVAG
jgi:uncharacterized protein (TIGR00369 family)